MATKGESIFYSPQKSTKGTNAFCCDFCAFLWLKIDLLPSRGMQISEELRRRFAEAQRVLVLTGAGVSAESGVPTFRGGGNTAVWKGMPFRRHLVGGDARTRSAGRLGMV